MGAANKTDQKRFVGKLTVKSCVRILLLYPVAPPEDAAGPFMGTARPYLMPTTQVEELYCPGAPLMINDAVSAKRVSSLVVDKVRWAESQGYDAVVVGCAVDPGVSDAKRAVGIPVIGIGEASRTVADLMGNRPAHIYPGGIPVLELASDEEKTYHELVKVGRWLIRKRGVDVLIPNCGYISGLANRLQAEVGVPVLPNLDIGLKMAELLATLNVRPEQPWVGATRATRMAMVLSRIAWQVKQWTHRL